MRKIFSTGFYQSHSALLLFGFAMLASYGLLINTLGTVKPDAVDYWQFFFALNISENPILMAMFCLLSIGYSLKAYFYVLDQLDLEKHFFVPQVLGVLKSGLQFGVWLKVYAKIMLPLVLFAGYMVLIGLIFGKYSAPLFLLIYVVLLTMLCAFGTLHRNRLPAEVHTYVGLSKLFHGSKSPALLYLYQVIHRSKTMLIVSKLLSCLLLWSVPLMVPLAVDDSRILLLAGTIVAMSHTILLYQERDFNQKYLAFTLNLPIPMAKRFFGPLVGYAVMLIPETGFILGNFHFVHALGMLMIVFSLLCLFRGLLLFHGIRIKGFLVLIFSIFFGCYLLIAWGLGWYIILFSFALSAFIYPKYYLNR